MASDTDSSPVPARPRPVDASKEESARLITRSAGKMGIATSISRVLGLARDVMFASYLGTSAAADAFNLAFRLPSLFRRLLGEGILSAAFIPVYTHQMETRPRDEVHRLGSSAIANLALVLAALSLVGIVFARPLVELSAWGWRDRPDQLLLTTGLTRVLFPYVLFVGVAALVQAILAANYRFTIPALSPVVLNVCFIGAGVALSPLFGERLEDRVYAFAIGGLVGGLGQLAIQIPVMRSIGFRFTPRIDFKSREVREILTLMGPGFLGLGVSQINLLVDSFCATFLATGSVTALSLGTRVTLLPLGVFGVAIAAASLPVLSRQVARGDLSTARDTLSHATRMIFFLLLPATVGLIVLRDPIVRVLFVRGAFTEGDSLRLTADVILFSAIGLFAYGGVKGAVQVFYSLKDTRTPVRIAAISVAVNAVLSLLLMRPLGVGGLALASSVSSIVNLALLLHRLRRRIGRLDGRAITTASLKMLAASAAMGAAAVLCYRGLAGPLPEERLVPLIARLAISIGVALVTYFGAAAILKLEEWRHLVSFFHRRAEARSGGGGAAAR